MLRDLHICHAKVRWMLALGVSLIENLAGMVPRHIGLLSLDSKWPWKVRIHNGNFGEWSEFDVWVG